MQAALLASFPGTSWQAYYDEATTLYNQIALQSTLVNCKGSGLLVLLANISVSGCNQYGYGCEKEPR